jgi:tRNA dimethylallyltransferase
LAILGPTATGKSRLALALAERIGAEILSVDSMQVYRGMDIGTAKPTTEERQRVRHHMIDVADPVDPFTVADFRHQARAALARSQADTVLIVGGSGLHFRSVVDPMTFAPSDPEVRAEIEGEKLDALVSELVTADPSAGSLVDLANPRRVIRAVETLRLSGRTPSQLSASDSRRRYARYEPEIPFRAIALDRDDLETRVTVRLQAMRSAGLLDEVEELAPRLGPTACLAVGYRQLLPVVRGQTSPETGFADAERATMRLVKRQRTFFRRDPRLTWIDGTSPELIQRALEELEW